MSAAIGLRFAFIPAIITVRIYISERVGKISDHCQLPSTDEIPVLLIEWDGVGSSRSDDNRDYNINISDYLTPFCLKDVRCIFLDITSSRSIISCSVIKL